MSLNYNMDPQSDINVFIKYLNEGIITLDMLSQDCLCILMKFPDDETMYEEISHYINFLKDCTGKPVLGVPSNIELKEMDRDTLIPFREYINEILEK